MAARKFTTILASNKFSLGVGIFSLVVALVLVVVAFALQTHHEPGTAAIIWVLVALELFIGITMVRPRRLHEGASLAQLEQPAHAEPRPRRAAYDEESVSLDDLFGVDDEAASGQEPAAITRPTPVGASPARLRPRVTSAGASPARPRN